MSCALWWRYPALKFSHNRGVPGIGIISSWLGSGRDVMAEKADAFLQVRFLSHITEQVQGYREQVL